MPHFPSYLLQALTNAIEFAEHNFENEQERNYIMQVGAHGQPAAAAQPCARDGWGSHPCGARGAQRWCSCRGRAHNLAPPLAASRRAQMVCTATTATDQRIRVAAFTCLHEIGANYYSKLPNYMQEVYQITVRQGGAGTSRLLPCAHTSCQTHACVHPSPLPPLYLRHGRAGAGAGRGQR